MKNKTNQIQKTCLHCNNIFLAKRHTRMFCCLRCQQTNKRKEKFQEEPDMVVCEICGLKSHNISTHIKRIHKIDTEEYIKTYNKPVCSETYSNKISTFTSGEDNPGYQHGGKFSALSDKFIHTSTTNKQEVLEKISKSNRENGNNNTTTEFWIKQGFTPEEAKLKIAERQSTFSLEKCIAKHGEEKGRDIWNKRQEKWQNNLNSKPPEEIERITRAKMMNGLGYSKMSQELFWRVYELVREQYEDIYFATLGENNEKLDHGVSSKEYFYISPSGKKFFFDFLLKSKKLIIEFDGDYWHGEARGNQQRDKDRDQVLIQDGYKILHISERDYKKDPNRIISACLEFING